MPRLLEALTLTLNLTCTQCNGAIYVPGLVERVVCPHCAAIATADWFGFAGTVLEGLLSRPGQTVKVQFFSGKENGRFEAKHVLPGCPICDERLPLGELHTLSSLRCSQGHNASVRPATDLARQLVPGAMWLVAEGATPEATQQSEGALLLLNCKACAGDLALDGDSDRNLECRYCSSLNVIPDELWIRLHPELQPRRFAIVAGWGPDELHAFQIACDLADHKRPGKRKALVQKEAAITEVWPECTHDPFLQLIHGKDADERSYLARKSRLPASLIEVLATDKSAMVRMAVAERAQLADDLQVQLASDPKKGVLLSLCQRETLADDAVIILVSSGVSQVVKKVLARCDLSVAARLALVALGHAQPLAGLPLDAITQADLAKLAVSDLEVARMIAAEHPKSDDEVLTLLAADNEMAIRRAVALHSSLSPTAMQRLAQCDDETALSSLARHPNTPADLLLVLAEKGTQPHRTVLRRVDCPTSLLEEAARSPALSVQKIVAKHKATTAEMWAVLAATVVEPYAVKRLLNQPGTEALNLAMASAGLPEIRAVAAKRTLPEAARLVLANDEEVEVRRALAQAPELSLPVALLLSKDADAQVVAALSHHPGLASRRKMRLSMFLAFSILPLGCLVIVCMGLFGMFFAVR